MTLTARKGRTTRTRTIWNTKDPVFNETIAAAVDDPDEQSLHLELWEDKGGYRDVVRPLSGVESPPLCLLNDRLAYFLGRSLPACKTVGMCSSLLHVAFLLRMSSGASVHFLNAIVLFVLFCYVMLCLLCNVM